MCIRDRPKPALPKYLTREESLSLLKNIQSDFYERDFCIITLFLNCGMRLSELVGIDLSDFRDDTIRILGKGGKERLVYLNDACKQALGHYCKARASLPHLKDRQALFVSKKTGARLTARRVEPVSYTHLTQPSSMPCGKFLPLSGTGSFWPPERCTPPA